jgi:hypothetical protein|tara:strand:- start:882 stop:1025 length:144 start_codon:yes stop_codon:yes gene_type:complete
MAKKKKNGLKYKPNTTRRIANLLSSDNKKKQQRGVKKMEKRKSRRLK